MIQIDKTTALILIDIQNDYFEGGRMPLMGSEEASEKARKILDKFREEKKEIIHIQHISTRSNATFFISNTSGIDIHKNVKPLEEERIIIKHYPNSFFETNLLEVLKSKSITKLFICGMMTHMCVDSTVRAAKEYGFDCTIIGDACATRDIEINGEVIKAEWIHKSFLAALNSLFAKVVSEKDC